MLRAVAAAMLLLWGGFLLGMGVYAIVRRWLAIRRIRATAEAPAEGRLLLLRPCAGDEPHLERCLLSASRASTRLALEVRMGVSTDDDAALPAARRAAAVLNRRGIPTGIHVVPPSGPNRKASTLAGLTEKDASGYVAILNADSNVDLSGYDLDAMVGQLLSDPSLGAVWAPPVEGPGTVTLGDRASEAVLTGSLHSFGLLGVLDPRGMVGKLFALRPQALVRIGGLGTLTDYLGEDVELSRRLHRAGYTVRSALRPVQSLPASRSLGDVIRRHARWMSVIRAQRPLLLATFPLLFASTAPMLVCAMMSWSFSPWIAAGAAALSLAGRLVIGAGARACSGHVPGLVRGLVDALLSDLVLLAALARTLVTRRVLWRGRMLTLDRRGRLVCSPSTT